MGIRFYCPNGHKLNVKEFQAGRKGICPFCGAKIQIPTESTRPSTRDAPPGGGGRTLTGPSDDTPDDSQSNVSIAFPTAIQPGGTTPQPASGSPTPFVSAPMGPLLNPVASPGATPAFASAAAAGATPAMARTLPSAASPSSLPGAVPAATPAAPGGRPIAAPPVAAAAATAPAVDPLTEAGEVVWYVRPASGGQFGPAGCEIMRTWLGEGRIGGDSLVWREGWREWQEAAAVFPQLRVAASAAVFNPNAPIDIDLGEKSWHPHELEPPHFGGAKDWMVILLLTAAVVSLLLVFFYVLYKP